MATEDNRATMYDLVTRTAEQCFMPLTVGGGVRTPEDVRKLLLAGADKVNVGEVPDKDKLNTLANKGEETERDEEPRLRRGCFARIGEAAGDEVERSPSSSSRSRVVISARRIMRSH